MTLLEVNNLQAYFFTLKGTVKAVDGVSFAVQRGQALGLAGESGCGKTTTALSVLKLLPPPGRLVGGSIVFDDRDLTEISDEEMRNYRWKRMSIIFQGAMNALNPVIKTGQQISEAILLHEGASESEAKERAEGLLELVGVDRSRYDSYPHELSGGMRQRSMIAMALACNPDLVIADEPATALDVIVQAQVLKLMKNLQRRLNLSLILITHDLSIIAETCDEIAIMYAGRIVEYCDAVSLFRTPLHPYTRLLLAAFPSVRLRNVRLASIPGDPPSLVDPPSGCRFHPRCPYVKHPVCSTGEPGLHEVSPAHRVACHFAGEI